MNIRFEYLYRDAGNFKLWGEVVFSNTDGIGIDEIEEQIRKSLIEGEYFEAEKIGIPLLRFAEFDPALDHSWHEFVSVSVSKGESTGQGVRDITEFLRTFKEAHSPTKSATRQL